MNHSISVACNGSLDKALDEEFTYMLGFSSEKSLPLSSSCLQSRRALTKNKVVNAPNVSVIEGSISVSF